MSARIRHLAVVVFALTLLAALAPSAHAAGPAYRGAQIDPMWVDSSDADVSRELDLVRRLGSNAVRINVGWDSLETAGKGQYSEWYVTKLDRLVGAAQARGMKVIAMLASTPCWASTAPESLKQGCEGKWWERKVNLYPPANAGDFGDAARWMTARYGDKLAALEVWNEPNLDGDRFLIASDKAGAYAEILKAAYPAAKAGNPRVPVLAGALAYGNDSFVRRMLSAGIQNSYDGLSIHPYSVQAPSAGDWGGINWARQAQRAAGQANKPLWITEFGWSTCRNAKAWCASPAQQAAGMAAAYRALQAEPNVRAGIAYSLRDAGVDASDMEHNFGLVRRDFTPKPAFAAMRRALSGRGVRAAGLKLRVKRHRRALVAMLSTNGRQRVALSARGCRASGRQVTVRTGRSGRAARRLGSAAALRGCKIVARAQGGQAAAAASVRVRG